MLHAQMAKSDRIRLQYKLAFQGGLTFLLEQYCVSEHTVLPKGVRAVVFLHKALVSLIELGD